jgi:hypothetical protein
MDRGIGTPGATRRESDFARLRPDQFLRANLAANFLRRKTSRSSDTSASLRKSWVWPNWTDLGQLRRAKVDRVKGTKCPVERG